MSESRPKRLLPFPWVFATRKLARRLIEHIESCHRIINHMQAENQALQRTVDELSLELNEANARQRRHGPIPR